MEEVRKEECIQWYNKNFEIHKSFCKKTRDLIEQIIDARKIPYQSITSRVKDEKSFLNKCEKEKYSDPANEITDVVGIRIITYINSDVDKICSIIENEFIIDYDNSVNKAEKLEENQVGYLSVHYIAKLKNNRAKLPEYSGFKNMRCEIQIRTLLQHAWAEIEHDRNYKFGGVLPKEIKRRFFLAAGTLEMVDREFQNLSVDIDKYSLEVKEKATKGELDIPIDSTSLFEYLSKRFDIDIVTKTFLSVDKEVIEELTNFGIKSLKDIENIIPKDYITVLNKYKKYVNFAGIMRDLMIINNYKRYFNNCWKHHWGGLDDSTYSLYKYYIPIDDIINTYEIEYHQEN